MTDAGETADAALARIGRALGPQVLADVQALYHDEQAALADALPPLATDLAYGGDQRQRLDLYAAPGAGTPRPVLLWVHGGGFVRGDKGGGADPFNAHVGRWAARAGMLGAVMNYRLAPDHGWPAGGEDVGTALDWLAANAADHGGDPERIVVMGSSAGAVHIATHLMLRNGDRRRVRAAVLLSGLYGFTPLDDRDVVYYGDPGLYGDRMPRRAVTACDLPLFFACAEYDPERFQAEWTAMLAERLGAHRALPANMWAAGHNHFSMALHLGTQDRRLSDRVLDFLRSAIGRWHQPQEQTT